MILASDVKKRYLFNVRFRVGLFYRNKKLCEIVVKQRGIMKKTRFFLQSIFTIDHHPVTAVIDLGIAWFNADDFRKVNFFRGITLYSV
ncbi:hypothetical protein [Cronobacter malonaticus]|uniref:hypothetical protein n=1 Tax=Cronobacter malonaticus TaxID=413503 RepID=UPI0016107E81|nr:hypothetical protein [Cronobacter malonaticus]